MIIEIIRQVPGTRQQTAKRGPDSEVPFKGIPLAFAPRFSEVIRRPAPGDSPELVLKDKVMELEQQVDYRFIPGISQPLIDSNAMPPKNTDPDTIKTVKRSINGRVHSGYTVCSDLGKIESGKFLTVFTRVDTVDAEGRQSDEKGGLAPNHGAPNSSLPTSGRRISDGKPLPPDSLPSPEVKGKLRLNAALVEIPLKAPRPPGQGLVVGLTPSGPKVAAQIKNDPRAKVRKLKAVEISLNQQGTPWPEFPGLIVSAVASKNLEMINVTSHPFGDEPGQFPNIWEEMPAGSILNFGIKTGDAKIERRLLITIKAVD